MNDFKPDPVVQVSRSRHAATRRARQRRGRTLASGAALLLTMVVLTACGPIVKPPQTTAATGSSPLTEATSIPRTRG